MARPPSQPDPASLGRRLGDCMTVDRGRLRAQIRKAQQRLKRNQPTDQMLARIEADLARSIECAAERRAALPTVRYPDDLPVAAHRERIMQAIDQHPVVVVAGATGSGKTTQLPKMCLELGRGAAGVIGHTQPRRLAARAVATRIAEELAVPLGKQVGFKMRFADKTDRDTAVKVMTDGILLAELTGDRLLERYDTLIIDEAHERSLNIDFILGCLAQLLPKRPDLKLIITSATIDTERFAEHFGNAPVIDVEGRAYPVEVRYRPLRTEGDDEPDLHVNEGIREALDELAKEDRGDVLVFLPGERDIREAAEQLSRDPSLDAEVLPLYARLPTTAQQRIFHPTGGKRRVILATNVAETSLTVPGIRHVIDSGQARISRYAARSKVQRLPIEKISQASANQRKGRCGRVAPGVCIRLYDEDDFDHRDAFTEPEIQRTNLASVILQMESLNLGDPAAFPFIDPPAGRMIRDGYATLRELGAIDDRRRLTRIGKQLARMPVDPRMGRMILAGREEGCLREVLAIAAVLSVQDPRVRPPDAQQAADEAHAQWFTGDSDLLGYWRLWQWLKQMRDKLSHSKFRRACAQNYLAFTRVREWQDLHRQLRDAAADQRMHLNQSPAEPDAIHRALLTGLLSNLGMRGEKYEYQGAHGRKFAIFPGSSMFDAKPRWVTCAELIETSKLYAHGVAPVQPQWIEPLAEHLVEKHHSEPRYDAQTARVVADERVTLFGLTIVPRRVVHLGPIDPDTARHLFITHGLVEGEYQSDGLFDSNNRTVIEQIERLEAKQRQGNLLIDSRVRYEFFDRRLPPEVFSGDTFEAWRAEAEKHNPRLLFMTQEMLMDGSAEHVTDDRYPDAMPLAGQRLQLEYTAAPGEQADGVTVTVPLGMITQLDEQQLDWLVPGMIEEKVTALMRSLPKQLRKRFVPIPQYVQWLVPRLEAHRDKPLTAAIAACVLQHSNVTIPPDAWQVDAVPNHLRMNVAVVDEKGRALGQGRDLSKLRDQLGDQTREIIRTAADTAWQRDGLTDWDFGPIPQTVAVDNRGMAVHGFPAIVDGGDHVSLRVVDTARQAAIDTRRGIRRLFALQCSSELAFLEHDLPGLDAMALKYAPLGSRDAMVHDMLMAAVDRTFIDDQPEVRDGDAFAQRLHDRGAQLQPTADEACAAVGQIVAQHHAAMLALDEAPRAWDDLRADIEQQLRFLLPAGFIADTPWYWLKQLPRYLKAIVRRLEKARDGNIGKDRERLTELAPHLKAWHASPHTTPRDPHPEGEMWRWMIEEYRLSLFAQELGTVLKVSPKRLEKQANKALRS